MPDVVISNHGSIYLFALRTKRARAWVDDHVGGDITFFGRALAVEARFALDLADGMLADGLRVS